MVDSTAREQSYIRALMVLGAKPRTPILIGPGSAARKTAREVDAYMELMRYMGKLDTYFLTHVFQGPTSALGNTDTWIEDFLAWQQQYVKDISHEYN